MPLPAECDNAPVASVARSSAVHHSAAASSTEPTLRVKPCTGAVARSCLSGGPGSPFKGRTQPLRSLLKTLHIRAPLGERILKWNWRTPGPLCSCDEFRAVRIPSLLEYSSKHQKHGSGIAEGRCNLPEQ